MNTIDSKYQELLRDILETGIKKETRNGGTISVFGRQIRHNMKQGFPLLTTKKMAWKSIVTELLWFLRGDTNIKFLLDYDCHIWDGDAYKNYVSKIEEYTSTLNLPNDISEFQEVMDLVGNQIKSSVLSKEEFINKIKTDNEFAKKWGELGPIYGRQWRQWDNITKKWWNDPEYQGYGSDRSGWEYYETRTDQIQNLINDLKTNPDSRRLMVSAWNIAELDQMVLPPCHYGFQVYTRELSIEERLDLASKKYKVFDPFDFHVGDHKEIDELYPVPKRAISLMWNQRSVDTFLGLPFNIASYGLLLEIIAKEVDMVSDELIGNLGDVHLYSNHIEQAKEQIGRNLTDELIGNLGDVHLYSNHIEQAKEQIGRDLTDEERYNKWFNNNVVSGMERFFDPNNLPNFDDPYYEPTPKRTREPFELPTVTITERNWYMHEKVKEHLGPKTFSEKILSYRPDCFELNNYKSHPKIVAPLSN